jgi:protein-tyrosine phosphatase
MLKALAAQGVDCVIATPHFYADDEPVDQFLARRDESYSRLMESLGDDAPRIVCGAEVRYYPGISKLEGLTKLKIGSTDFLMIEMPVTKWTEYTVRELVAIASRGKIKLILAHVERYYSLQSESVWRRLYESGAIMQVNANFFRRFATRMRAMRMLKAGGISFIGSDCHNMTSRAPNLGEAYALIEKKLGENFVSRFIEYAHRMIGDKQ